MKAWSIKNMKHTKSAKKSLLPRIFLSDAYKKTSVFINQIKISQQNQYFHLKKCNL